jgi:hypothetical protein
VGSTTDLARWFQPGDLPTFSTARDGTLQLVSNNNSGDEVQLRRDGTLTYVNGGDSPAIFSVSMHCPLIRKLVPVQAHTGRGSVQACLAAPQRVGMEQALG